MRHAFHQAMPDGWFTACGIEIFATARTGPLTYITLDNVTVDLTDDANPVADCPHCRTALLLAPLPTKET